MSEISFEGIACPLVKPCFIHLELLSVQRYEAQKSSSSHIESQWGVKFCISFVSKAYGLFFAEQIITGTLHALTLWICGSYYNLTLQRRPLYVV